LPDSVITRLRRGAASRESCRDAKAATRLDRHRACSRSSRASNRHFAIHYSAVRIAKRAVPNPVKEVFPACAAAALYRRDAFEAVGGFDLDLREEHARAAVLALSSIAHGGKCHLYRLVHAQRALAGHPQGQLGRDQRPSRDVEKAQGDTVAPGGRSLGNTENDGEGLAEKAVNGK